MSLTFDDELMRAHGLISEALSKIDLGRARLLVAASCPDHGARLAQVAADKLEPARAALLHVQEVLAPEVYDIELIGLGY